MYGDSDLVNRTPGMTDMHVKENPLCKMLGIVSLTFLRSHVPLQQSGVGSRCISLRRYGNNPTDVLVCSYQAFASI